MEKMFKKGMGYEKRGIKERKRWREKERRKRKKWENSFDVLITSAMADSIDCPSVSYMMASIPISTIF